MTVEVRTPYLVSTDDFSLAFWRKAQLPERVKDALERALDGAEPPLPTTGQEVQQLLERLDDIERRLQFVEQQKSLLPK